MPAECLPSSFNEYLNTLGELQGFLESQQCDVNILVGDFNVDFDRGGPLAELLVDSMSELNLYVCDLSFHSMVKYTYERDDGLVHSWIGHIVYSQSFLLVTDIYSHHSFWHQLVRSCSYEFLIQVHWESNPCSIPFSMPSIFY